MKISKFVFQWVFFSLSASVRGPLQALVRVSKAFPSVRQVYATCNCLYAGVSLAEKSDNGDGIHPSFVRTKIDEYGGFCSFFGDKRWRNEAKQGQGGPRGSAATFFTLAVAQY